jgi:hypothetical protein
MKKRLLLSFTLIACSLSAQIVRPLFGFSAFRNTDFNNQTYFNIALGAEFKAFSFLKPEIEVSYTFGLLEELTTRDDNFLINSISQSRVSAVNFGVCPKILVYNDDEGWYSLNISPRYTFSKITASNEFATINPSGNVILPLQKQETISNRHSLGIGLGICVNFSQKRGSSMALNLYFNNIELGDAINKLENNKRRIFTKDNLGLGLVYYFNL